uniref:PID domain-containing protein n=1 Tax=Heterorhabditis bacteriophora TaxID=37862 RepID=A0A1I7W8Z9_HETBA
MTNDGLSSHYWTEDSVILCKIIIFLVLFMPLLGTSSSATKFFTLPFRRKKQRLKPELRCHAVLCKKNAESSIIHTKLQEFLHAALQVCLFLLLFCRYILQKREIDCSKCAAHWYSMTECIQQ